MLQENASTFFNFFQLFFQRFFLPVLGGHQESIQFKMIDRKRVLSYTYRSDYKITDTNELLSCIATLAILKTFDIAYI